jgi:hypothetical protein
LLESPFVVLIEIIWRKDMANAYGPLAWKLDTAGTISTDTIRVKKMRFMPNAADDDLLVSNSAGDKIWEITNALAGGLAGAEEIDFGDSGHDIDGFVLTTLTAGGVLYVWIL